MAVIDPQQVRDEAARYADAALASSNREWYLSVVRVVDHLIEREAELTDALVGERRLREQLANALARATGRTLT